jgi:hypothetical protein
MSFWMMRYRKLSGSKLSRGTRIRFMRWERNFRLARLWTQSLEATLIGSSKCRQLRLAWSYAGDVTSFSSM